MDGGIRDDVHLTLEQPVPGEALAPAGAGSRP